MNMTSYANELLRRHADFLADRCASCGAEMTLHFSHAEISPENPNGFLGCPAQAKDAKLVESIADLLVMALAGREGCVGAHLRYLDGDVQAEYLAASRLALARLGLVAPEDPRRI